ncbi:MAG: carbamoyl-phosphate synthase large subunit [Bdellovibrionia bacterium]
MPRKAELKKVLIIGSGPIVIGQACEFDYSGTQACKALMKEGLEVVLVNSNPATIMTDPEIATRVYVEPLTVPFLEKIIETERPQAVIPTLGGQTALNAALQLAEAGVLSKYNVQLLGATPEVIKAGEDREIFRGILDKIGAKYPKSFLVRTYEQGLQAGDDLGFPIILRPNYTLGGGGGGIAYSLEEYQRMLVQALHESPTSEVLVEASILGWKEFELEVMRDHKGTMVVVCSIENFDPCGVHTGDSITVAPQQTLSDIEYQAMRDEAFKIIQEVGIQTGGANIQFAVHPLSGERVVIEMNPRVSRSSALASKATGFPIAKIAALLAVGYSMDELKNDITKVTPSCYEPALDYVVTKIPRFAFEKFPGAKDLLTTQMKSVGEVMGIGRTLQESFMKALASLESHPEAIPDIICNPDKVAYPNSQRVWHLIQALRDGMSLETLNELTAIHPYFLEQLQGIVQFEQQLKIAKSLEPELLLQAKRFGFTDARIGKILGKSETAIRELRHQWNVRPKYTQVDTCAGEFESFTPYFYSSYWSAENEAKPNPESIAVIGSGPNRIGQGIEFDYSCVRGVKALQKQKIPVVMINSNPETVSTDYDTSDFLFFEPLTFEHVSEVMGFMQVQGFVAQLGGQTPIGISHQLVADGFNIFGSSLESIDLAEDRSLFSKVCLELGLQIPKSAMAGNLAQAQKVCAEIGFPIICRPSYVLGGRRMEVVENPEELESYFARHGDFITPEKPALMDQFLAGALEVDVDLVRGLDWLVIGGVMEHIEAAGVHSGDSMGVLPPQRLKPETEKLIEELSSKLAHRMNVLGHLNLQLAVKNDVVYVLEANPRSSRSVPFIAKATGIPLIDLGILAMLKKTKAHLPPLPKTWHPQGRVAVKGVVFPFRKFSEADSILGPEMKSTGESMGQGKDYSEALMKAFISSHVRLPHGGEVFLSLREKDKEPLLPLVRELSKIGFRISATTGTAKFLNENGIDCLSLRKVHEGRPHCVDHIRSGQVNFVINTTTGRRSIEASFDIRRACTDFAIPCVTESDAAEAFVLALRKSQSGGYGVQALERLS